MVQLEERLSTPGQPLAPEAQATSPSIALGWYTAAFVVLMLVGLFLRVHRLGERAIHHDESLHALYSWYLYVGRGYVHDPMMHGPWQFHWTALIYFLFGDSDFTARLAPVLFGTALIGLPYFLRRELGRTGALVASILLTISPVFLYFSRFAREDIYFATWNAIIVVGLFGMIRTHRESYLYLAAVGLAGGFATKEAIYISGFIWVAFFALLLTVFRRTEAATLVGSTLRAYPLSAYARAVFLTVAIDAVLFTTFLTNLGDPWNCLLGRLCSAGGLWTGTGGALLYWFAQHDVQRGGQPWYYYLLLLPLYEFVPLALAAAGLVWMGSRRNLFTWFCLWWAALALLIYSYAGEKMPWITPHITLPILFLAAQFLGAWLEQYDLKRLATGPALAVAGLGLLAIAVTLAAIGLSAVRAMTPLERQTFLLERLGYVLVVGAVGATIVWLKRRRPGTPIVAPLGLALLLTGLAFYIHTAWQVTYAHGDVPVEMLVYVQSSPDVPQVVAEIERISFQTGQGKDLRILMDNGYTENVGGQQIVHEAVSWPFEWYLRHYRNRRYYSRTIGPDLNLADYPVALVMAPNLDPVRERLSEYNGQRYKLNWWYPEDYKGLTPRVIVEGLTDPSNRARLLQYLLYRDVLNPLGAREFYFFARKEIPPLGPAPLPAAAQRSRPALPPVSDQPRLATLQARPDGGVVYGRSAEGAALLAAPKDLAVGPDGRIYTVESAANRVTVFHPDGSIALAWGRPGSGDGEFNEPWGIAVAPSGEVYVADTWNHRIQKFDPSGRFLAQWGGMADTRGQVDQRLGSFWGPRDIALDGQGQIYVTDTGNKRIQVFDPAGRALRAFGGEGSEPGRFQEPVGLAIDGETLYVADTWNGRIQRLDLVGSPLAELPVTAWQGQSLTNKPYLAPAEQGIYYSAPDQGLVNLLGADGRTAASIQPEGPGGAGPGLPTGVAVGPHGELFVADSRAGVIYRLPR
jgi:uncharacterized protein (TIGR03663 family)